MADEKCYYFDNNVLVKHYIPEKSETEIRRLSSDAVVYISNWTYLELLGVLMRFFRSKEIKKKKLHSVIEQIKHDIGTSSRHRFQLITVQESAFHDAGKLILAHAMTYELSANDALHIAMAKMIPHAVMVTSDGGKNSGKMKGVCHSIGLAVLDPEISDAV
ncbi:MAG: type II toxin-antitoxin system VapC family toxin [Thiotrichaceae bacterium]|nr:type II toxin-antitoxin system VapC family toxin [Thiotrichaceae bacterium]